MNFLDKSAEQYVSCLMTELKEKNFKFDKPIAFLLNPPYKNTDENVKVRDAVEASYQIHPSILELTGNDAGRERYLAFLGQIINIARVQMGDLPLTELNFENIHLPAPLDTKKMETPLILIFTPTSWLIPRPTYISFRKTFDKYFKYEMGFIILGNEFFKIKGRFPIAFTIWSYKHNKKGNKNNVVVKDLTHITNSDLQINWNLGIRDFTKKLQLFLKETDTVKLDNSRGDIKDSLPLVIDKRGKKVQQTRLNIYRNRTKEEVGKEYISGFPKKDPRHQKLKVPYGYVDGEYIGFMDDLTPVRLRMDAQGRLSRIPDRVWFYLDNRMISLNINKIFNGTPDKYGFCAVDIDSSRILFSWFAIAKALNGRYPVWANQYNLWIPTIQKAKERYFYSLSCAFGLAENRCVVTKFEKDNPVIGALEVFVDNPLCPTNPESFWSTTLDSEIVAKPKLASNLVGLIRELYKKWNQNYCKGQLLYNVGLHDEPYFKYFDYNDFVTPYSGLIQIRKYAELHKAEDLLNLFEKISTKTKETREEIYSLLTQEFGYFE